MPVSNRRADKGFVTISEPMTLVTDYLLGTLAEACAILLLKYNRTLKQQCVRLWACALIGTALASYLGGTYHGFQHMLSVSVAAVLWTATTLAMGAASFFLLAAAFTAAFSGQDRRWLIGAAALKLAIYSAWMLGHDEFRFVIYDYGSTLAILLLLLMSGRTTGLSGHAPTSRRGFSSRSPRRAYSKAAFVSINISITTT